MAFEAFALILAMLGPGMLFARLRALPDNAAETLNKVVLYVCLPAAVLTYVPRLQNAERCSRHVKEDERVAYLKNFERELEKRHVAVLDNKNDRCLWLKAYPQRAKPADLGATFLRYDVTHPVASTSHAVAFALCIEGMIWGTATTPPGKKDHEPELFGTWWALPWQENPILENLGHDKGFGDTIMENKADVAADTAAGKVIAGLVRFVAVQYLMEQVGVFTLTRPASWRGAIRNNVDALIHRLAGTDSEADAAHLRGCSKTATETELRLDN